MFLKTRESISTGTRHQNQSYSADQYAKINLCQYKCQNFVWHKNKFPDKEMCHCGGTKDEHETHVYDKEWKEDECIKRSQCLTLGEMKLTGFRVIAGFSPKYIRVGLDGHPDIPKHVFTIMNKYWEIEKPELIISINGGAKKMQALSNDQQVAFKRGLINVSKNAPTWIVTGGFQFGVVKMVGDAAKDFANLSQEKKFTLVGIGTWGAVANRKDLEEKNVYSNVKSTVIQRGEGPLDPFHDVFLLCDNGYQRKFGLELEFRAAFESYVSSQVGCPVIQVIVEGGKKTIITAARALEAGTPIVVMKGSKRAADVICSVVVAKDDVYNDIINSLISEYEVEWSVTKKEKDELSQDLKLLRNFYIDKKMVHIFSMSDFNKDLDKMILEAAFSRKIDGKEIDYKTKLQLCMTYNQPAVAEEIFESNKINLLENERFIRKSLCEDQWQFMELFLSFGLTVESFLTKELLLELYYGPEMESHINSNVYNILKNLLYTRNETENRDIRKIGRVIRKLSKTLLVMYSCEKESNRCNKSEVSCEVDDYRTQKEDCEKYMTPTAIRKKKKTGSSSRNNVFVTREIIYTKHPPRNYNNKIILTEQDLFLWALIVQRFEMAKIFWKNGKDHIGSALIASIICSSLANIASQEGEVEMMNNLLTYKNEFQKLAIDILSEAYWRDKTRAHLLLIRALPYISRSSCMEIAEKNQIYDFMFHSACQTRLQSIWLGGMSPYLSQFWILLNIPFGLVTTKFLIFPNTKVKTKESELNPLAQLSIDEQPENIDENNPGIQEMKESEAAKREAAKMKKKSEKQDFLVKFYRRQHQSWNSISYIKAVAMFYRAPIIKFYFNIASYMMFLGLFSYFCLVELNEWNILLTIDKRPIEIVVYIYVATYIVEELRQIFTGSSHTSLKTKLAAWVSSLWNVYDLFMYISFIIAIILRHLSFLDFVYARTIFSLVLSLYFIRSMQFYYINKSLGPKVIMINKMIKDIGFFLAIYIIAVFAYGTFAQALLFPNSTLNGNLLKHLVYLPYWQTYGELELGYVEGTIEQDGSRPPTPNAMVLVAFAIFMLFSNILLLNLLIAMFGNTFNKVEENSNRIWAFTRYKLINEFYNRPILPPPFNVFEIIWLMLKGSYCHCKPNSILESDEFVVNLSHEEDLQSSGFEQQCMETYLTETPLFADQKDLLSNKSALAFGMQNDTRMEIETGLSREQVPIEIKSQLNSLTNIINDMRADLDNVSTKVVKIRRHQKRHSSFGDSMRRPQYVTKSTMESDNDE